MYAESHRIYPTREDAEAAIPGAERNDDRYTYEVAEVYQHIEDDP